MDAQHHDLVIIGGGPAGMTAAIYAKRANLDVIILESNITGGLVNSTHTVENVPSYPRIHGMELMEKMRAHVDELGVQVEEICEIERLELASTPKRIHTQEGLITAQVVILATGRQPIPLKTPTEAEEVHHCAICDGTPYVGKRVLVVGGGNSAFDESLYLLGLGVAHLTLVEVADRFFAAQSTQERLLGHPEVQAHTTTVVRDLVAHEGRLCGAVLENTASGTNWVEPVDGVFVFLGQHPNNSLFADQVELNRQGYVVAKADMSTNLPGVFAAGDITDKPFRQITTAMGDGTVAALAAEHFLRVTR